MGSPLSQRRQARIAPHPTGEVVMGTPTMIEKEQALLEVARYARRLLRECDANDNRGIRIAAGFLRTALANLDRLNP
jgi:hypothetical protein